MTKIIIADDSGTARLFVRRCLEIIGLRDATFEEVKDGTEALSRLETAGAVDYIVTDLTMYPMDGTELLKKLKEDKRWREIPVFVVTSAGNDAKKEELLSLGAISVLPKPVSPAIMAKAFENYLK